MSWQIIEPTRHWVAIAGSVVDAASERPLGGVTVEVTGGPQAFDDRLVLRRRQHGSRWPAMAERLDRTRTAGDGHFHFLDLPAGEYTLAASLPAAGSRYGKATAEVVVAAGGGPDSQGNLAMATADMALPPTTVEGSLTENDSLSTPVALAEVRVVGSGERTFSQADGSFSLRRLEKGRRTLRVSARGYQAPPPQAVDIAAAGDVVPLDLDLEPA